MQVSLCTQTHSYSAATQNSKSTLFRCSPLCQWSFINCHTVFFLLSVMAIFLCVHKVHNLEERKEKKQLIRIQGMSQNSVKGAKKCTEAQILPLDYGRCLTWITRDALKRYFHIISRVTFTYCKKASLDGFKTFTHSYSSCSFNVADEGHSMLSTLILWTTSPCIAIKPEQEIKG